MTTLVTVGFVLVWLIAGGFTVFADWLMDGGQRLTWGRVALLFALGPLTIAWELAKLGGNYLADRLWR